MTENELKFITELINMTFISLIGKIFYSEKAFEITYDISGMNIFLRFNKMLISEKYCDKSLNELNLKFFENLDEYLESLGNNYNHFNYTIENI